MTTPAESRPHRVLHAVRAVLAAALLASLAACGGTDISRGHALLQVDNVQIGGATIRLGDKLGYLFVYLHNISRAPLTIYSVTLLGTGIGTVVKPVQEKMTPLTTRFTFVGGGGYATDPPVRWTGHTCLVQDLRPLRAYRMAPGSQAVIWVVFKAVGSGHYDVIGHALYYTQGGTRYRQVVPQGYRGAVSANGMQVMPDRSEKHCLAETTLLNP